MTEEQEIITKDFFGDNIMEDSILHEVDPSYPQVREIEWKPFKKKWKNKRGFVWFARSSSGWESGLGECGEAFVLKKNLERLPKTQSQETLFDGTSYQGFPEKVLGANL